MKQHSYLLRKILSEGWEHPDRTKVGRISLFGEMLKFNMRKGFPLTTTRKIPVKAMINELLWFISGSTDNKLLNEKGIKIWDKWTLTEEHLSDFIDRAAKEYYETDSCRLLSSLGHNIPPNKNDRDFDEEYAAWKNNIIRRKSFLIGSIGRMYGDTWRSLPNEFPDVSIDIENVASDVVRKCSDVWDRAHKDNKETMYIDKKHYTESMASIVIDQLNNLIVNLKERPFSSRHVVTAWIPELVPYEDLSPQDNIIMGKGALAACHTLFQFCVAPPLKEGDKLRLSLCLYMRSNDVAVGFSFNIPQYALLLSMVAQVVDMEPYEFTYHAGDCHIYKDQVELVEEQISREPMELPTLWLNPEVKSLFDFTIDDIRIENYNSHPAINYPLAV